MRSATQNVRLDRFLDRWLPLVESVQGFPSPFTWAANSSRPSTLWSVLMGALSASVHGRLECAICVGST